MRKQEKEKTGGTERKLPDSLLMPLIRSHYIRMASMLENKNPSKKVAALKKMRLEMKRRFMLLYQIFRMKKYGEPVTKKPNADLEEVDEVEDFGEDAALIAQIKLMVQSKPIDYNAIGLKKQVSNDNNISDLESIQEDGEESEENDTNIVKT